jgi:hypothetical protein
MKLLFKIIQYIPETEQIVVKCCRQNAPKSIDDYDAVALDLMHVDFSNYENFKQSLIMNLLHNIGNQIENEPILPENQILDEIEYENINDYVNKIVGFDYDFNILPNVLGYYQNIKKIDL